MMDPLIVAFTGIFLGCLCRTVLPYLRKARENPQIKFELKYLVVFAISLISSFIAAITLFATFTIPETAVPYVFASAFVAGFGANDLIAEIIATRPPEVRD